MLFNKSTKTMKNLKKTALVTGANKGIGKAIAIKLIEQGIKVIGTSTTQYGVQVINTYLKKNGFGLILDLKDTHSISEKIKEIYKKECSIDILINNAGAKSDKLLINMSNEAWEDIIKINLTSIFYTSKAVIRSMIKKKEGRIITISSIIGYTGNKGQINYSSAKAGLIGFHKTLALEVASKGITVNIIAPGLIQTEFIKDLNIFQYKNYLSKIPMKRLGTVEEIADAVIFLSSKKASYITGQTLHINGGMYM